MTQVRAFIGVVNGTIPADLGPPVPGTGGCVFSFTVPNSGSNTLIGNYTGSANFRPNVCDGSYVGSYDWTGAHGERMSGPFMGQLIPTATQGVNLNVESSLITGGNGRFQNATGMMANYGVVNFATGTFAIPYQGTVSFDH